MFPNVTAEAQGLLCSSAMTGLEEQWCEAEGELKRRIAVATTTCLAVLLCIAGALTTRFVVEKRHGHMAYQAVLELFKKETQDEEELVLESIRPEDTANK
eukprot:211604-Rhodomonas_salina.1